MGDGFAAVSLDGFEFGMMDLKFSHMLFVGGVGC